MPLERVAFMTLCRLGEDIAYRDASYLFQIASKISVVLYAGLIGVVAQQALHRLVRLESLAGTPLYRSSAGRRGTLVTVAGPCRYLLVLRTAGVPAEQLLSGYRGGDARGGLRGGRVVDRRRWSLLPRMDSVVRLRPGSLLLHLLLQNKT